MLRLVLTIGLVTPLSACATSGSRGPVDSAVWTDDMIIGSMWTEVCPGGEPEQTWLSFYEDGTFAYLYPNKDWTYDGNDTWKVEGGDLVVAWNDNFASTRYRLDSSGRLTGRSTKSCPTITLEYTGPAPDLDWTEVESPDGPNDGDPGSEMLAP
jgi:hypothetical protein